MITTNLFDEVLAAPIKRGATELFVVTGYISAAMVTRQFEYASQHANQNLSLDVFVGMTGKDGISVNTLLGLQAIPRQMAGKSFNCTLAPRGESNHTKLYVWCNDRGPVEAFLGSSNFTQVGFGLAGSSKSHRETMTRVDPDEALSYFFSSSVNGIGYRSSDIASFIDIHEEQEIHDEKEDTAHGSGTKLQLPLFITKGKDAGSTHQKSGLNWGQREGRNPNQAYIPVPVEVSRSGFFPPNGVHFQVVTDDGESFICTVAQAGGKAIETPHDNALLGQYFRKRLGINSGAFVDIRDLKEYGSTFVSFTKISDDLFLLDFQPGITDT